MTADPSSRLRTINRAAWGLAGLLWFLWLGVEDGSVRGPLVVAAAGCLATGLTALRRWWRGPGAVGRCAGLLGARIDDRWVWLAKSTACGAGAGLLVGPLAALLMLVKVSLHDHPVPEFGPPDLAEALLRTPAWALAGMCLGAALGLAGAATLSPHRATPEDQAGGVQSQSGEER